jgi:Arc/MetJ-type ribon-helix-helix transcriptional regulator
MKSMVVQVDAVQAERIERLVSEGAFLDTNHVLYEAVNVLENKMKREHLRGLLQHGLDSGEPRELTEELIEEIDLRAQRRAHAARSSASDAAS